MGLEGVREKKLLYIILGTNISGNRQVVASLFEDKFNNRFWLEYLEGIKPIRDAFKIVG